MKKIGVISDTHIPIRAKNVPDKILKAFEEVDFILHAGDLVELYVLDELKKVKDIYAVFGNTDPDIVRKNLPQKRVIEVENFKIGLIHGMGAPFGIINRIKKEFEKVNCIIFGHTHTPCNEVRDGVLFFNPGSPTDRVFTRCNFYGILYISDKIEGKVIEI